MIKTADKKLRIDSYKPTMINNLTHTPSKSKLVRGISKNK